MFFILIANIFNLLTAYRLPLTAYRLPLIAPQLL